MLFTAVRSQEFVSLTVVSDRVWWTKCWWPPHYPIQGSGCEGIREEVTCDAGSLEAVTWQPVGGAVYMQNAAINSVKCLPEPQIRRQDCYHRLKSFQSASMEIQNGSLVGLFDPLACREVFILWMSWKHTHTHTHTCRLREDRRKGKMVTDDTWKRCPCNEVSLLPRSLRGGGLFDFKEGQSGIERTRWHTRMAKAIINDTCISSVFLYLQHFPAKDIFQKQFYCFKTFHTGHF